MRIKTLMIAMTLALPFLALPQTAHAQTDGEAQAVIFNANNRPTLIFTNKSAKKQGCGAPKVKFHNLGLYKGNKWWRVFQDKEVAPALKTLLKKDYLNLTQNMKQASYPEDSLSFVDRKGVLTLRGFVPGLFTIMEAMLIVEPCGNIYAAMLDDGGRFLYFSNDQEYIDRLPPAIEEWRTGIERARSKFQKQPELPVVLKSK